MKRRTFFIGLGGLVPGLIADATKSAQAESNVMPVKQQFVGTWKLVEYETRDAGGKLLTVAPWHYTDGLLIYDQLGTVSLQLVDNNTRPALAQGNFVESIDKATLEELKATVLGYLAYFGTYTVEPQKSTVTHHIEASTNNYKGTAQVRNFEFKEHQLILTKLVPRSQATSQEQITTRITWERIR